MVVVMVTEAGGADRVGDGDRAAGAAATAVMGVVEEDDSDGHSNDDDEDDEGASRRRAGATKAHGTAAGCDGMRVVLLARKNERAGKRIGRGRELGMRPGGMVWMGLN